MMVRFVTPRRREEARRIRAYLSVLLMIAGCGHSAGDPTASCSDGARDGTETGVDCGGGTCAPCADRMHCVLAADCATGRCVDGFCGGPFCDDGVKNGGETDLDCGGPLCIPCGAGRACRENRDCAGGLCQGGVCTVTCGNGERDGNETDVDCGGSACLPCGPGLACHADGDCARGGCVSGHCAAPPLLVFDAPDPYDTGLGTRDIRAGDLDGDGYPDLAFASWPASTPQIGVMLSRFPGGRFTLPDFTSDGFQVGVHHLVAFTDFDGDGHADALAWVLNNSTGLYEMMSGSDLGLAGPRYAADGASAIAVGDVNGDGIPDLVIGALDSLAVHLGKPGGGFRPGVTAPLRAGPNALVMRLALGDADGDGHADCAVSCDDGRVGIAGGDGGGGFGPLASLSPADGNGPATDLALADFDGDGALDYAWTRGSQDALWVMLGKRSLAAAPPTRMQTASPRALAIADFDGDGHLDIATGGTTQIAIFSGHGNGAFDHPVTLTAGSEPLTITAADFNLDGKPDIAAADSSGGRVWLLLNRTK